MEIKEIQWESPKHPKGSLIVFEVNPEMERALLEGQMVVTSDRRFLCLLPMPKLHPDFAKNSGIIHGTSD